MQRCCCRAGSRGKKRQMDTEDNEYDTYFWRESVGCTVGVNYRHKSNAQCCIIDELSQNGGKGTEADGEQDLRVLTQYWSKAVHEEAGYTTF